MWRTDDLMLEKFRANDWALLQICNDLWLRKEKHSIRLFLMERFAAEHGKRFN
ncbi:hypothetical protein [Lysinibacillus yapensis]|uniref:hypothetical protein n=1 Tax=Ureibacillus yapensis TaxID=2304605 RepID=UPI001314B620|nr:hypothetical protein [Lysinibacillus yapensis]